MTTNTESMDDTQIFHQQQQEERQYLEHEYVIAFDGCVQNFKQFVIDNEVKNEQS